MARSSQQNSMHVILHPAVFTKAKIMLLHPKSSPTEADLQLMLQWNWQRDSLENDWEPHNMSQSLKAHRPVCKKSTKDFYHCRVMLQKLYYLFMIARWPNPYLSVHCGRKLKCWEETHTHEGEHVNSVQKGPSQLSEPVLYPRHHCTAPAPLFHPL